MSLIDTLEHYYGNHDDQGNLQTQGEPQPTDEPFDMLEEEPLNLDDLDEDEDEELDDVIEDNDPSYGQREKEQEEN